MTIYLYVKTHRKTGLKYLGKTKQKDPHQYRGSGKYWKDHIKKHGYDVDTEILRECQSNEEVRQWGLYYSELWQVVASNKWANLKEESGDGGDGFTSEQSCKLQKQRVADNTHPFLGGEMQRRTQQKRGEDGTHHVLGGEIARQSNKKRVEDGTHHLLGGEIARQSAKKRVEDGSHNFLGGDIQRQRVSDGTHNFLGGDIQRQRESDGTHHFQTPWTCPHCGKSGKGTSLFNRWHGDNCKSVNPSGHIHRTQHIRSLNKTNFGVS